MYFFTADEHYWHRNIIEYCSRPYADVVEMNEAIIANHNSIVGQSDTTIHAGDFALCQKEDAEKIIRRLNGKHVFMNGSHDRWMQEMNKWHLIQIKFQGQRVYICHFCMKTWPASHYNTWHLYGHSHGALGPVGKSWDIGVDNNNFFPLSEDDVIKIMEDRPNNFNYIKRKDIEE